MTCGRRNPSCVFSMCIGGQAKKAIDMPMQCRQRLRAGHETCSLKLYSCTVHTAKHISVYNSFHAANVGERPVLAQLQAMDT